MPPEPIIARLSLLFADGPGCPIENRARMKAPALAAAAVFIKFLRCMRIWCWELKKLLNFANTNVAPFDFDIGHFVRVHL